jgi:hypothetical protein
MKAHLSSPSGRRPGLAAAAIGFVILVLIVRSRDASVVLAVVTAAALFGALVGTYSRAPHAAPRRRRRSSPAVAVSRPAREIAITAAAATRV